MGFHVHFAVVATYLLIGIVLLVWALICAVSAERLEKEGVAFRTAFLICAMFTPVVGLIAARVISTQRAARPLAARSHSLQS
jgi:hypothetical protein